MHEKLNILKATFGNFEQVSSVSEEKLRTCINNSLVVLPAGGESSRFKSVEGALNIQKSAFTLPSGETMLERTIKMYRNFGMTRFLILLYHHATSVEELLGNGEKMKVSITYSYDPGKPVGRGGALAVAFNEGLIKEDEYLIVHNPDDQFVGDTKAMFTSVISAHLAYEEKGGQATAVVSEAGEYPYSALLVEEGKVTDASVYPPIPIPTHTGVTVFSPGVISMFSKLFDLKEKTDFEPVLFPHLIAQNVLFATPVPAGSWIPVNDEKGLKHLIAALA